MRFGAIIPALLVRIHSQVRVRGRTQAQNERRGGSFGSAFARANENLLTKSPVRLVKVPGAGHSVTFSPVAHLSLILLDSQRLQVSAELARDCLG
jgi:hypothetical protein